MIGQRGFVWEFKGLRPLGIRVAASKRHDVDCFHLEPHHRDLPNRGIVE